MSKDEDQQQQSLSPQTLIQETPNTQNLQQSNPPQDLDQQKQEQEEKALEEQEQQEEKAPEKQEQQETEQQQGMSSPTKQTTNTHIPTITIPDPVPEIPSLITPTHAFSRRGPKRKKFMAAAKKREALKQKLPILAKKLIPIPFFPKKPLDYSTHDKLLKRTGLWDFVHIEFDRDIRTDLLAQLIVYYNPQSRCSYVNEVRINVSRADLARAMKLTVKKDKANANVVELKNEGENFSDESIAFVEDFVSNWILLHEDMWMMPNEVLNWIRVIKDGNPEKVDWASLLWFMVEKELAQGSELGHCYYASHLQCLIKSQRETLFKEEPGVDFGVKQFEEEDMVDVKICKDGGNVKSNEDGVDVKMSEDGGDEKMSEDGGDVKLSEDGVDVKMNEVCGDMNMGGDGDGDDVKMGEDGDDVKMGEGGNNVKIGEDDGDMKTGDNSVNWVHELEEPNIELSLGQDNIENEQVVEDDHLDFKECKEQGAGQWALNGKNNVGEHFLQRCLLDQDRDVMCNEEKKQEGLQEDEEVEEHEQQEERFNLDPKCDTIEGISSANLIQTMEAEQNPFGPSIQLRDPALMEHFTPRAEANAIPGGPSMFSNANKREIDHEHDISLQSLHGNHKRLRIDDQWDEKSTDFDVCMDHMQQWMGKARILYEAKEHACAELNVNQQLMINELQQRENMIEHIQKLRYDEQQKRQVETIRLERELYVMTNLLDGYKKALKETRHAFYEYRTRCPLPDEPFYSDVPGSGGVVVSAKELEKRRLMREEEDRIKRFEMVALLKEFEAGWTGKFEVHINEVNMLSSKLLDVEKEVELFRALHANSKSSLKAASPANE